MKKNDERILKYFSDLMNEKEKNEFLQDLNSSEELRLRFEELKNHFEEIKDEQREIDERYFAALLPKIREKAGKKERKLTGKIIYAVSTVAAVIILMLIFKSANSELTGIEELADEFYNNADSQALAEFYESDFEKIFNYYEVYNPSELPEENLEQLSRAEYEYYNQKTLPVIDDYDIYTEISKEELDEIYNSLQQKKIL